MSSPYDILIDIRAKADEVQQAVAAITGLVEKAAGTGTALASGMAQGQAATQAFNRDVEATSAAVGQIAGQAAAAGGAVASGMAQGSKAAKDTANAVEEVNRKTKETKSLADEASESWTRFGSGLKDGLMLGFGTELAAKAIEIIGEIPKLFVEAIEKGVEFDKEMETLGIGLAGALRQAQPEKYLSFTAARSAATEAIASIQQKANALGLDFKAVGEAVQTSMLPLVEGGITNINQQIDVMTLLMQASAAKGIRGFQAQRDAMDILAGRAERVMLGRELGITNEDIKRAQQAGTLYDYLVGKLGAYQEAGEEAAQTFAGLWQSVQNLFTQLEGTAAKPVFDELKSDLAQVKTLLDSIEARGEAQTLGIELGGLIDGAKQLYRWLSLIQTLTSAGSLGSQVGQAVGANANTPVNVGQYAAQLSANQQIVESLRQQAVEATTAKQIEDARHAVELAIGQAQQQVATATGDQKTAAETLLTALQAVEASIGRTTTGHHQAASAAGEVTHALAESNGELDKMLAKLPALIADLGKAAEAAALAQRLTAAIGPAAKLAVHQEEQGKLVQDANATATQAGGIGGISTSAGAYAELTRIQQDGLAKTEEQAAAAVKLGQLVTALRAQEEGVTTEQKNQADLTEKLNTAEMKRRMNHDALSAKSKEELNAAEDKIKVEDRYQELVRSGEAPSKAHADAERDIADARAKINLEKQFAEEKKATGAAGKQAKRDERAEDNAADRERKTALQEIKNQMADLKGDPFQTDAQKIPQELALLEKERQQLIANIKARQDYIDQHAKDPGAAVKSAQLGAEKVADQRGLAQNKQQTALLGGGGQIKAQLTQLQNQWALTSTNIGKSITQNIQTAVDGVSNAIDGLIMGTHNWRQAFGQAGQAIVKNLIQLGVQMIANAILGRVLGKTAATEQATNSGVITAAAAPAAAVTSVSTSGTAAIIGAALAIAAIAAIIAMATSHASGGLIPGSPSHSDNRFAHVASGEYVVRTSAVQHYGPDFFHRLNSMSIPRTGFATGGLVGERDGYRPILATMNGGNPNVSVGGSNLTLIQTRDRSEMLQALQSTEGRKIVLGHVKNHRTTVGIRS